MPRRFEARTAPPAIVRAATRVERLVYTRTQAAEALSMSRSTFNRRVLPLIETVEMSWGTRVIPADELERVIAEWRRPAREQTRAPRSSILRDDAVVSICGLSTIRARLRPSKFRAQQWL